MSQLDPVHQPLLAADVRREPSSATEHRKGSAPAPPQTPEKTPGTSYPEYVSAAVTPASIRHSTPGRASEPFASPLPAPPPPLLGVPARKGPRCGTNHDAEYWFHFDCCGMFCAGLTWVLLGLGWSGCSTIVLESWMAVPGYETRAVVHQVVFGSLVLLAYWSHLKAMLTDPGAIPLDAVPVDFAERMAKARECKPTRQEVIREAHNVAQGYPQKIAVKEVPHCRHCGVYKPPRAHHCRLCNRCVVRMDHHCPWINSCVGARNHKFFLQFCFYTLASCSYVLGLLLTRFVSCARRTEFDVEHGRIIYGLGCGGGEGEMSFGLIGTLCLVLLTVETSLFGLFTMCMLCDQYSAIADGATQVEKLKLTKDAAGSKGAQRSVPTWKEKLHDIFGDGPISIWWFLPVDPKWKRPDLILEYVCLEDDPVEDEPAATNDKDDIV